MAELDDLNKEEEFLISTIIMYAKRLETVRERIGTVLKAKARDPPEAKPEQSKIRFNDRERTIQWGNGMMRFTIAGSNAYRLIKIVYHAGADGAEHQEIAEQLFGDELANIKSPLQSARITCEKYSFPWIIENENGKITLKKIQK